MAGPMVALESRRDTRSAYAKAVATNPKGTAINVCPFGCTDADLDVHGYCKHLIGFCNTRLPEGRVEKTNGEQIEVLVPAPKGDIREKVVGPERDALRVGDILVRITQTCRVYRQATQQDKKDDKAKQAPLG